LFAAETVEVFQQVSKKNAEVIIYLQNKNRGFKLAYRKSLTVERHKHQPTAENFYSLTIIDNFGSLIQQRQ